MSLFLFTFFLLYGAVHLYAFIAARNALSFGGAPAIILGFFMLIMIVAPVVVRLTERRGMEAVARFLAYAGYTWMGLLFLFFSAAVAIDLYRGLVFIAAKLRLIDYGSFAFSSKIKFFAAVAWACIASVYGAWEATRIRTERIVITTRKLPENLRRIRIAQISDVHMGLIVREGRIRCIVKCLRQAAPDVIVSTGDLVDGQLDGLSGLARMWNDLKPRFGKFAVTGNHEFYAGLEPSLSITEQAGFQLLQKTSTTIAGAVVIAGVDDPAVNQESTAKGETEHAFLESLPHECFILLLKHRPKVDRQSLGLFDLQLSGHVHKGQIFPFNLITFLFYPVKTGYSLYPSGSSLYVSRGSGTWGPPIRFLAPPEVTIIDLVKN